jgi:hypothetical protein
MNELTLATALKALGFEAGWAGNEHGITMWLNTEPQPSEAELTAAGWVKAKAEATDETPTAD